jgi:hypothetical protein
MEDILLNYLKGKVCNKALKQSLDDYFSCLKDENCVKKLISYPLVYNFLKFQGKDDVPAKFLNYKTEFYEILTFLATSFC